MYRAARASDGRPIDRLRLRILNHRPVPVKPRPPEPPDALAAVIHRCPEKGPPSESEAPPTCGSHGYRSPGDRPEPEVF